MVYLGLDATSFFVVHIFVLLLILYCLLKFMVVWLQLLNLYLIYMDVAMRSYSSFNIYIYIYIYIYICMYVCIGRHEPMTELAVIS